MRTTWSLFRVSGRRCRDRRSSRIGRPAAATAEESARPETPAVATHVAPPPAPAGLSAQGVEQLRTSALTRKGPVAVPGKPCRPRIGRADRGRAHAAVWRADDAAVSGELPKLAAKCPAASPGTNPSVAEQDSRTPAVWPRSTCPTTLASVLSIETRVTAPARLAGQRLLLRPTVSGPGSAARRLPCGGLERESPLTSGHARAIADAAGRAVGLARRRPPRRARRRRPRPVRTVLSWPTTPH